MGMGTVTNKSEAGKVGAQGNKGGKETRICKECIPIKCYIQHIGAKENRMYGKPGSKKQKASRKKRGICLKLLNT